MLDLKERDKSFLEKNAFFPVAESEIRYAVQDRIDEVYPLTKDYKGIYRPDTNTLISIQSKNYKLIENKMLVEQMLELLAKTDQRCELDMSHTYATNKRMRLQIKFPEIYFIDEESREKGDNIPLSLFVHNSYDGSEGIRLIWGAIRGICTNGMIFGLLKGMSYHKHTSGANVSMAVDDFNQTIENIPIIQKRIELLEVTEFAHDDKKWVEDKFSKTCYNDMNIKGVTNISRWQLINLLTYWVSHHVNLLQRYQYQKKLQVHFEM